MSVKDRSDYPKGFSNGVVVANMPVMSGYPGRVYWVGNNSSLLKGEISASDGNDGSYYKPWSTLNYGFSSSKLKSGDILYVRPGYTETITAADSILMSVAGVTVIGLGAGSSMPCIEYNHADATVGISANNISVYGINFNSSITGVTVGVNVKANVSNFRISDCRFDCDAAGTDEFLYSIRFVDGNAGCIVENCLIAMGIAGAAGGIHLDADTDGIIIRKNIITGDYSTACIVGDTTLSTNVLIEDNLLVQGVGGNVGTEPGIELLTGTTGIIRRNDIVCNLTTKAASIVADQCFYFENYYNEDVTGTGGLIGAVSDND